ncbi:MAG: response regulator [Proteobacteria bacterium]|nr:response regulator [Pseudomonadota bacterium]MBU1685811.1 response regulator [Pseudomonadota bacterium]
MGTTETKPFRILIVDDEHDIHKMMQQVLCPDETSSLHNTKSLLQALGTELFNDGHKSTPKKRYQLTSCSQGEEAVKAVQASVAANERFAMVFLDMKMPPGKDGLWTAERIRTFDQDTNIMIMTAFTDVDPAEIAIKVPPEDKLLYLQKPVRPEEVRQFAASLCSKWHTERALLNTNEELGKANQQISELLDQRTEQLHSTEQKLDQTRTDLLTKKQVLTEKDHELEQSNIALRVLLQKFSEGDLENLAEREEEMNRNLLLQIKELTEPFLLKLKKTRLNREQQEYLAIIKKNLDQIISPVLQKLLSDEVDLSPAELKVANLIKQNKSTKEIANLLNLSIRTIEFHRDNIRKKLGISGRKTRLKTILMLQED